MHRHRYILEETLRLSLDLADGGGHSHLAKLRFLSRDVEDALLHLVDARQQLLPQVVKLNHYLGRKYGIWVFVRCVRSHT